MGGDHHGHSKIVVPDWKIYKVEEIPELNNLQECLKKQGLRDPWLRNEVWRFHPAWGTKWGRFRSFFFTGFKYGFAAFLVTIAVEKAIEKMNPTDHGHGHGHH